MRRHIVPFTVIALLSASLLACDKPGATEQQKEDKANEQAANARTEAMKNSQTAQASAEKDIAAAQAQFEKSREDYRHTRRVDLADLDKKVVDLEAEQRTATGKTKANLAANVPAIRVQRDAYVRDLQALDTAAPATWDSARANLDKKWETLKEAVDHAR
jgi:Na+-translocating ferredoxin:NAD+ oxidoreductase RnfG subunit